MAYRIKMTDNAISQMQEAVSYISKDLLSPETAREWAKHIKAEIGKLDFMPGRIPLTKEEPWRGYGVHQMVAENFLVYFWIEEDAETVWVTAVAYGKRNQRDVLGSMPMK